jgi:hypothetical protein
VANQIEVHLSTGKIVSYDGQASDIGTANRAPNGLVQLKEWGEKRTFYLNPEYVVLVIDHGSPENAGDRQGRTVPRATTAPAAPSAPPTPAAASASTTPAAPATPAAPTTPAAPPIPTTPTT